MSYMYVVIALLNNKNLYGYNSPNNNSFVDIRAVPRHVPGQ